MDDGVQIGTYGTGDHKKFIEQEMIKLGIIPKTVLGYTISQLQDGMNYAIAHGWKLGIENKEINKEKAIYEEGINFQELKKLFARILIQMMRLPLDTKFIVHMDIKVKPKELK